MSQPEQGFGIVSRCRAVLPLGVVAFWGYEKWDCANRTREKGLNVECGHDGSGELNFIELFKPDAL